MLMTPRLPTSHFNHPMTGQSSSMDIFYIATLPFIAHLYSNYMGDILTCQLRVDICHLSVDICQLRVDIQYVSCKLSVDIFVSCELISVKPIIVLLEAKSWSQQGQG